MWEAVRKSRGDGDGVNLSPESPADPLEDTKFPLVIKNDKRNWVPSGIPNPFIPPSPSQQPADLELGRHVPHFICWFFERSRWHDYQLIEIHRSDPGTVYQARGSTAERGEHQHCAIASFVRLEFHCPTTA